MSYIFFKKKGYLGLTLQQVPPGGHVESGESLKAAGLRELQEETGLELGLDVPSTILGLWESVYPHSLVFGKPVRQHIVVYLAIRSELTWRQLAQKIKVANIHVK
jgi:8-oxo-dGTP pyrophosphatase MutT (NUDIX family)